MGSPPSSELLRRSRTGDAAAMRALMQQHLAGLRAFVRVRMSPLLRAHESGSDLVQSACLELLHKLDAFEFRGEAAFRAWLYQGVLNTLRDKERALRAQKRDARREVGMPETTSHGDLVACYSSVLSPSGELIAEERIRALEGAFDDLPDDYREVISLSRIVRLSRAQVAEQMGRTEDSVRNLLPRALAALAEALRRRSGDSVAG
ncbi:MAG: sigma-70 family RNA polymerase sigma factor [Planctomycetota bacterium]